MNHDIYINLYDQYFINGLSVSKDQFYITTSPPENQVTVISEGPKVYQSNLSPKEEQLLIHIIEPDDQYCFVNEELVTLSAFQALCSTSLLPLVNIIVDPSDNVYVEYVSPKKNLSFKPVTSKVTVSDIDLKLTEMFKQSLEDLVILDGDQYILDDGHPGHITEGLETKYYPSPDAIQNYNTLQESEISMEITLENVLPQNRTLVIVYGSKDSPSDFRERASRLIGSLNMPETIKVVVITVNGDRVFSGLDFTKPKYSGEPDPSVLESVRQRFVQVLEVKHGGS